jgi:CubicO group peptidase (beta-lactamase class C family)
VDVLGRLVEVLSGLSFDEFLHTRIFEPLGMEDTYFYLPSAKSGRLAALYSPSPTGGIVEVEGTVDDGYLAFSATYSAGGQRTSFPGGAGLSSTARDYSRFLQMMLNGGELDGARLLSPTTVRLMTSNHTGDLQAFGRVQPGLGGFGLGFAIDGAPTAEGELGSEGIYRWEGFFNTLFWVDPEQDLIGIMMTQLFPNTTDIQDKFRIMTYQTIVER